MDIKIKDTSFDVSYNIAWHDGLGRYVTTWTWFEDDAPKAVNSFILTDGLVTQRTKFDPHSDGPSTHYLDFSQDAFGLKEFIKINFLQLVKELKLKAQAEPPQEVANA